MATWSRSHSYWCIHAILDSWLCVSFSAFQPDQASSPENPAGCRNSDSVDASVANKGMVSDGAAHVGSSPRAAATPVHHAAPGSPDATSATPPEAGCHSSVRRSLQAAGLSARAEEIVLQSWKHGTHAQYKGPLKKWHDFCDTRQLDPLAAPVAAFLDFLADLHDSGLSYSAVNTARSAVSTILFFDNVSIGKHPLVKRFMRGVFNARPALPKHTITWDAEILLNYLKTLKPCGQTISKIIIPKIGHNHAVTVWSEGAYTAPSPR